MWHSLCNILGESKSTQLSGVVNMKRAVNSFKNIAYPLVALGAWIGLSVYVASTSALPMIEAVKSLA